MARGPMKVVHRDGLGTRLTQKERDAILRRINIKA